jgi:hypothetical protein
MTRRSIRIMRYNDYYNKEIKKGSVQLSKKLEEGDRRFNSHGIFHTITFACSEVYLCSCRGLNKLKSTKAYLEASIKTQSSKANYCKMFFLNRFQQSQQHNQPKYHEDDSKPSTLAKTFSFCLMTSLPLENITILSRIKFCIYPTN